MRLSSTGLLRALFPYLLLLGCTGDGSQTGSVEEVEPYKLDLQNPIRVVDGNELGGFARIAWAGQLSDGTIVVGDRRLTELSVFPTDSPPFIAGGRGSGPGEFAYVWRGGILPDDAILASGQRLSVFSPQGQYVRAIPVPFPGPEFRYLGALGDSRILMSSFAGHDLTHGFRTDSTAYHIINLDSGAVHSTFSLPDRVTFTGERLSSGNIHWTFPPFFGRAAAGVFGHRILWGHGSESVLYLLDEAGAKTDSIQLEIPPRPLEVTQVDRAKRERMSRPQNDPSLRRFWEQVFDEVEFPEFMPFFDELLIDSKRMIWVRKPPIEAEDSVQWWGFEETGEPRKVLTIPSGLGVLEFRDSTVLVIETSELDVERVLSVRLFGEGS